MSNGQQRTPRVAALALAGLLLLFGPASAERYHYDPAGRLILVIYDDLTSIAYEYDPNGNLLSVASTAAGIPGDANLDGVVNAADLTAIVTIILDGGQPYSITADCNGDDRVSVADLACVVTAIGPP